MTDAPAAPAPSDLPRQLLLVAALAVLLGFGVQGLVLAAKLLMGATVPLAALAVDVAAGVAWATVVCTGASIGVAVRKGGAASGLIAALFAPIAVGAAKATNQAMAAALGVALKPAAVALVAVAALKSVEYGVLGYLLARLSGRDEDRLAPYALTGLAIGILFGAAALALRLWSGAATPAEIAAAAVNEAVFPMGCAAVVYAGRMMGQK